MKISYLGLALCAVGTLTFARTWEHARVLDASCLDQTGKSTTYISRSCAPTGSTTSFAFKSASGHIYRMDAVGNERAEKALESGAMKANRNGVYHATVIGHKHGDTVAVNQLNHGRHTVD